MYIAKQALRQKRVYAMKCSLRANYHEKEYTFIKWVFIAPELFLFNNLINPAGGTLQHKAGYQATAFHSSLTEQII